MNKLLTRRATPEDAAAIAWIYNEGIADRIATFETEPRSGRCVGYAERGFWKIVSRIFPENTASLALHERCGFRVVGTYQRHGKLEGEWRDCVIAERLLDEDTRTGTR